MPDLRAAHAAVLVLNVEGGHELRILDRRWQTLTVAHFPAMESLLECLARVGLAPVEGLPPRDDFELVSAWTVRPHNPGSPVLPGVGAYARRPAA